ncbi:MAG: ATP-binding protein [Nitrososphaeria archaeon]
MLFSLRPKESLKELYNRSEEYHELSRLTSSGLWVAVLGKRMTGKTSLIKTFANENKGIYINLLGAKGVEDLAKSLLAEAGLKLDELTLNLKFMQIKWSKVLDEAFQHVKDKIIVLDEVQEISSPQFLKTLKSILDKYSKIRIVFSGSYIGVLRRLLEPSPTSPLYGRKPVIITLKSFSNEMSKNFLISGFQEYSQISYKEEEIVEAVERLDGYVGWLTYYGNFRCERRLSHKEALEETMKECSKIIQSELNHFLKNRRRELYIKTLRTVRNGARWSEIKRELNVNSKVLNDILKNLTSAMIVDENKGYYWIEDPITREAIKKLRP